MAALFELLIIFGSSFGLGLIPFAGPSNMLLASTYAITFGYTDPASIFAVGFFVAIGSALAKSIHYMITFFISGHLSEKRRQRLDVDANKIRRWAFWLLLPLPQPPFQTSPL
jgi:membrane protein DedA with SNARE-associated domain